MIFNQLSKLGDGLISFGQLLLEISGQVSEEGQLGLQGCEFRGYSLYDIVHSLYIDVIINIFVIVVAISISIIDCINCIDYILIVIELLDT